jgi:RNA methyltransferase, TrmH family
LAGEARRVLTKAEFQRLRSLREKKNREALGLFVIEGEKVVGELLAAGFPFAEIYATEDWPGGSDVGGVPPPRDLTSPSPASKAPRPEPKFQLIRISIAEMARASHFPTPSSVLAVGTIARAPLVPGALDHGLTLALDRVQDAGNVGTLLRIADWFGCARVLLSPDCADLFHQKVVNASMGSFARVATHTVDLVAALETIAPATPILGCDLEGDDVHTLSPLRDAVVVIGNEGRGLSPDVAARVTRRITIPRPVGTEGGRSGGAESLNAAVAAAIVCDNLRRPARP